MSSEDIEIDIHHSSHDMDCKDVRLNNVLTSLTYSNWFSTDGCYPHISQGLSQCSPSFDTSGAQMKLWKLEIKHQESLIIAKQRSSLNIHEQQSVASGPKTLSMDELHEICHSFPSCNLVETIVHSNVADQYSQSPFTLCMNICNEFNFNNMQRTAFLIAANSWLMLHAYHALCNSTSSHGNCRIRANDISNSRWKSGL